MNVFDILTETAMSQLELTKHEYASSMMRLIAAGTPLAVVPAYQAKFGPTVIISKSTANSAIGAILAGTATALPLTLISIRNVNALPANQGKGKIITVPITAIEKSAQIKGKGTALDFNIGGIGEICLGVAATARFLKLGQQITDDDFVNFANFLKMGQFVGKTGKVGNSKKLTHAGTITHANGKQDNVFCVIVAPGRDVTTFMNLMRDISAAPASVLALIQSAVIYANDAKKIDSGILQTSRDPNTNNIEIVADGQSDNKGTKADLVMNIDQSRITLISAKAGPSQLGQASGKEFSKQIEFFSTVFGVDISSLKKTWIPEGKADNTPTLTVAWQKQVIPKILRLTGGDSAAKEKDLIKSISNGLIRYANDHDTDTGETSTVDIVKLITTPGSPGYSLVRIDSRLEAALSTVDLVGTHTERGIQVSGRVNGKNIMLFRAWSYYSPAGQTTRTAIAGGPLLDTLATLTPQEYQQDTQLVTKPSTKKPMQQAVKQTKITNPKANTAPATAAANTVSTLPTELDSESNPVMEYKIHRLKF